MAKLLNKMLNLVGWETRGRRESRKRRLKRSINLPVPSNLCKKPQNNKISISTQ